MTQAFIAGLGPLELGIILVIVLVIIGGKRLPMLGRQVGAGMREFKDSVTEKTDEQFADSAALAPPSERADAAVDGEATRDRS